MIIDLLTPPRGRWEMGQKNCAVAHPTHVSNSHTKFGLILSNGSGESITGGQAITIFPSLFKKSVVIMITGKFLTHTLLSWQN